MHVLTQTCLHVWLREIGCFLIWIVLATLLTTRTLSFGQRQGDLREGLKRHYMPGGHLYFRLDIILIKGLSKHTLNTYFSGMKIDPKYAFLQAFFLICLSRPFQNLLIWPKTHHCFSPCNFARFCTLNNVRTYIDWSLKTTLITWFFLRGWYPTSNTSAPPLNYMSSVSSHHTTKKGAASQFGRVYSSAIRKIPQLLKSLLTPFTGQ